MINNESADTTRNTDIVPPDIVPPGHIFSQKCPEFHMRNVNIHIFSGVCVFLGKRWLGKSDILAVNSHKCVDFGRSWKVWNRYKGQE